MKYRLQKQVFPGGVKTLCLWMLGLVWMCNNARGRGMFIPLWTTFFFSYRCIFWHGCVLAFSKPRNVPIMCSRSWATLITDVFSQLQWWYKAPESKRSAADPAVSVWYVFLFSNSVFFFSWDQEAGAVKRPLNATGAIAAMLLIISVLFFVPEPRRKKTEFRLFKSFKDMNFEVEHNYHYV